MLESGPAAGVIGTMVVAGWTVHRHAFFIVKEGWEIVMVMGVLRAPLGVDRANSDLIFFTSLSTTGPPAWVVLPIVFVVVAVTMTGLGEITGSLEEGKSADFIVLNQNPWEVPSTDLADTCAEQTWFAGECVYRK